MKNHKLLYLLAICACLLPAMAAFAQSPREVTISLQDSLRMGLENNLALMSARLDPEIADAQVLGARAAFEPLLSGSASHSRTEQQPVDPTQPTGRETTNAGVTLAQNLGWGGNYSATFFTNKSDAPGFNFFNPFYTSGLDLRMTVPLLEGLGNAFNKEQLILARAGLDTSREDLRRRVHDTLEAIEGAYWDLVSARRALEVSRRKLTRANDLLELNRKKVEVGTLAPIEITQAEAGVAGTEEEVIVAENNLLNAQDALRQLLAVPQTSEMWEQVLVPTDEPSFARRELNLEEFLRTALQARPEMISARQDLENKQLSERNARRRLMPGLNFDARVAPSGDSLDIDAMPVPVNRDVGESISEIPEFNNYTWSATLSLTLPLGNKADKSSYAIARLNRQKSEIALLTQEQAVRVELRRAVRGVDSGIKRVQAAGVNVELQKKKLEAEQKKFENGMSTSFEVLTFQNDLADAELSQIRALLDYNKALVTLEKAKGTLMEARGFDLGM